MSTTFDMQGNEFISRLDSWRAWRAVTNNFRSVEALVGKSIGSITGQEMIYATAGGSTCPFCYGSLAIEDTVSYGKSYCLCHLLDYQRLLANELQRYCTPFDSNDVIPLRDMDTRDNKNLKAAIESGIDFINELSFWLVILGPRGTGKTNILFNIAQKMGPMALYISADDFEHKLFEAVETNTVTVMMNAFRRIPVLLFDDWGIEYGQVSGQKESFVTAKLRGIINYRYSSWKEKLTVLTSNMTSGLLMKRDSRLASRLHDHRRARLISLGNLSDYRIKNNGRKK